MLNTNKNPVSNKQLEHAQAQVDMRAKMKADSCLNPNIPLGVQAPPSPRPEFGPSVAAYFAAKQARGECGRFDPLYKLALNHGSAIDRGMRLGTLNSRA